MAFTTKLNKSTKAAVIIGSVALATALLGPYLGLGETEHFVIYRMAGITRRQLAYFGALFVLFAIFIEATRILYCHFEIKLHKSTRLVTAKSWSIGQLQQFVLRRVPLCFTAVTVVTFLIFIWILPAEDNGHTSWTTEILRQYSLVASGDQRKAYLIAVILTVALATIALVMNRRHVFGTSASFQGAKLSIGVSITFVVLALAAYALIVPRWLTEWASLIAAGSFLIVVVAPYINVPTIERAAFVLVGAYLAILIVPGFLARPITLIESDPNALSQFEQHLLLLTMPGPAISAGQDYLAGLPYNYGLLFPSIMSVIDRHLVHLTVGDQLCFVQYSQLVFSLSAVAAYLAYRPHKPFGVLVAVLLAGPFWATAGLGIWHPNQTGFRSDGFPIGFLILALTARMPPSRSSWILGAMAGITLLANLETAVALSAGYAVFLIVRTQKFPITNYLQCAAASLVMIVLYLTVYTLVLGRFPFARDSGALFAYLERYLGGDFGLRLFSGGEYNTNYFIVPFALVMFAHAVYVVIDGFRAVADGPLPPRRAFRVAVATTLILWLAYYFNAPNWWQIWTHLFLYGFLLIDLLDHRYFGIGFRTHAPIPLLGRLLRVRISAPRLLVLFLLMLYIPENTHRLHLYLRDFMYPTWTRHEHRTAILSGVAMPETVAQALQLKAHKLSELYAATNGRLTYLTFNMTFMPALTGIFEPDPYRDLWVGVPGDAAFDGIMQTMLDRHPLMILIDSPTGPLAVGASREDFQNRVRRAVGTTYHLTSTVDGWQIWQVSKPVAGSSEIGHKPWKTMNSTTF